MRVIVHCWEFQQQNSALVFHQANIKFHSMLIHSRDQEQSNADKKGYWAVYI